MLYDSDLKVSSPHERYPKNLFYEALITVCICMQYKFHVNNLCLNSTLNLDEKVYVETEILLRTQLIICFAFQFGLSD